MPRLNWSSISSESKIGALGFVAFVLVVFAFASVFASVSVFVEVVVLAEWFRCGSIEEAEVEDVDA